MAFLDKVLGLFFLLLTLPSLDADCEDLGFYFDELRNLDNYCFKERKKSFDSKRKENIWLKITTWKNDSKEQKAQFIVDISSDKPRNGSSESKSFATLFAMKRASVCRQWHFYGNLR